MARSARLLLALALLGVPLAVSRGYAQKTAEGPAASAPAAGPDFLLTLPRPPDQPRSLLAPPPPPGPPPPDLERPYFQEDPLLDPPELGLIGWFGRVDVGILKPHLVNQLSQPVTFPDGTSTTVGVAPSRLDWTVSPRFEVGYRLPSGFGGVSVAYRFMTAQGSESVLGGDGPATLTSRLNVNVGDLDWVSNEFTPWRLWDMRVRFGLRYVNTYFDSRADEPFDEAAAGGGIFQQRTTNSFVGFGPHAGVDLRRRLEYQGLSVFGQLDLSESWGRVRQNYFASSTTPGPDGLPQTGLTSISSSDAVPILTARLGLNYQPPAYPNFQLFAGYQLDYWWNTGRLGNFGTFGYFFDSGVVFQAAFNY
ncbi:MAG TPA: Lpg1974 family pore-forming outer membrane protein [Gemmataceae bacterium]|jgi:hypothetical protein|nr:Lpg1974 family pore-forming outer membrane protein [Gemmataceae bacterium]